MNFRLLLLNCDQRHFQFILRWLVRWQVRAAITNGAGSNDKWEVNKPQSIFGKSFVPFGLAAGKNFMERPRLHQPRHAVLGARNIDGRGFDKEENRPTNLQIPLVRK